jgi:aminopeptidase-like protein
MQEFFKDFIGKHYMLNRAPVNADTDILIKAVQEETGCEVIKVPAGAERLTWTMPKRWDVREARVIDSKGRVVVDFADHPMHLWQHSIPVHKQVDRKELLEHIVSDPERPERIPFHFRNTYRFDTEEWGFCMRHKDAAMLQDDMYTVHIDASLDEDGSMKIADWTLPGEKEDTILFAAHSCHPGQVVDGLSNIAVLIAFWRKLSQRKDRRYSYRFVIGPEYFTGAAFLAERAADVSTIRGGMYLDFLGNGNPISGQSSFSGDSLMDKVLANVLQHHGNDARFVGFRELCGNDEIFYDGPGYHIPMPGLAADVAETYHSDADDLEHTHWEQLDEAVDLLLHMSSVLEDDVVPTLNYKGPLYLSGHGLQNRFGGYGRFLQSAQTLVDNKRSCFEIAWNLGVDFSILREFFGALAELDLCTLRPVEHFKPL